MIGVLRRIQWRTVWVGICELVDEPSSRVIHFSRWAEARYGPGSKTLEQALRWLINN